VAKRILILYFISRICAKNVKNLFTCVKVIAIQRWDRPFLRHGVEIEMRITALLLSTRACAVTAMHILSQNVTPSVFEKSVRIVVFLSIWGCEFVNRTRKGHRITLWNI